MGLADLRFRGCKTEVYRRRRAAMSERSGCEGNPRAVRLHAVKTNRDETCSPCSKQASSAHTRRTLRDDWEIGVRVCGVSARVYADRRERKTRIGGMRASISSRARREQRRHLLHAARAALDSARRACRRECRRVDGRTTRAAAVSVQHRAHCGYHADRCDFGTHVRARNHTSARQTLADLRVNARWCAHHTQNTLSTSRRDVASNRNKTVRSEELSLVTEDRAPASRGRQMAAFRGCEPYSAHLLVHVTYVRTYDVRSLATGTAVIARAITISLARRVRRAPRGDKCPPFSFMRSHVYAARRVFGLYSRAKLRTDLNASSSSGCKNTSPAGNSKRRYDCA